MFNIRTTDCQAMFIFSNHLLYQGLGKQSLEYFHQAYLMASALGIHKEMPGLNEMDKDERRWIRFTSYNHDSHLCSIMDSLNLLYQINPDSKDPNEFLIAECNCLTIKCFNMYWVKLANLMNKYSQLILFSPQSSLIDSNTQAIYVLQKLFNLSLIRIFDLHLSLSWKCKNPEESGIVKKFTKMHIWLYHNLTITLNSLFSPSSSTLELDQSTKKQLWSTESLYRIATDVNSLCLPMLYCYLCSTLLLYTKLILTHGHIPQLKELFLGKLKLIYDLFRNYRTKYTCLAT
ncbi:hypothetical protein CONCODRAFT_12219 [Conidiobolus coronatus NRRL 28638]|uniref:Transcription factor domain-containing protein n=1 Tax=Conidiobolus coronatus (strain ATCC 28846 / CBS 209.66 / NRRL 28638) TaxID=796925 RepID=A0A137NTA0_CONC2|nr:hypothetical protein CONCODRAFT_12219 [Conidiobolus coronatus NRRL 28638]|eukprot:KXN66027.1 hypothetical protein CONCODRAFT_12219 [Conidiobolus coronatus NRRL 28638]